MKRFLMAATLAAVGVVMWADSADACLRKRRAGRCCGAPAPCAAPAPCCGAPAPVAPCCGAPGMIVTPPAGTTAPKDMPKPETLPKKT